MSLARVACLLSALLLGGCPAASTEPPPPTRKAEVPIAPPHALGALAAGTDAAPHPDTALPGLDPDEPVVPLPPPPAGALPDAGAPPPEVAPPSAPDAGMAL